MEKSKVIQAYRRGIINLQECAQILGIDSLQVMGLVKEHLTEVATRFRGKQPAG
jgi:predicted HTH domain antitoxin